MLESFAAYGYTGLFLASFLAATILPLSSEVVFAAMILAKFDPWLCLIIASVGNWLGGMTNYYLGRLGKTEWIEKYLKPDKKKFKKVEAWMQNKGAWTAFFSFLPAVGDLIALVLGLMRANVYIVNISMFLGKFLRYAVLFYGIQYGIKWLGG